MTDRPPTARVARCSGDAGSALMLMPAAMLIMIILGAIAADMSHAHMNKRDLVATANSIANDAVTYGVDPDGLRFGSGGAYPLDRGRVEDYVQRAVAREPRVTYSLVVDPNPPGDAAGSVTVTLEKDVDYIFAKAIPGTDPSIHVVAVGRAEAQEEQ